jgi:hypothetical protein
MNTNVNLSAPLGAMAFLGTALVIAVAVLFLIYSLAMRKFGRAGFAAVALLIVGALYVGAMLIFAFASSDKVLARGSEKHFCEIDCHLAYSVVDVKQNKGIGDGQNQVTATGMFAVVTIKTRFDETTIGPNRGDGQLYPNSRVLTVVDDQGRKYSPSVAGQQALELTGGAGKPLTTPLQPSEFYASTLVFDLPMAAKNPTLLITEGEWITHLVIGHENSLLHRQTRFQL